jgi:hypothetical protein
MTRAGIEYILSYYILEDICQEICSAKEIYSGNIFLRTFIGKESLKGCEKEKRISDSFQYFGKSRYCEGLTFLD